MPQLWLDVDRVKAKTMNVPLSNIFGTLQTYLGSSYVNDFTLFGRTYRVTAQADAKFRLTPEDIRLLKTRNASGGMVPLGAVGDGAGDQRRGQSDALQHVARRRSQRRRRARLQHRPGDGRRREAREGNAARRASPPSGPS